MDSESKSRAPNFPTVVIHITPEDIRHGTDTHSQNPLALAIKRCGDSSFVATVTSKDLQRTRVWMQQGEVVREMQVPSAIAQWLGAFYDNPSACSQVPEPFTLSPVPMP